MSVHPAVAVKYNKYASIWKRIMGLTYQESLRCFPEFRDPARAH